MRQRRSRHGPAEYLYACALVSASFLHSLIQHCRPPMPADLPWARLIILEAGWPISGEALLQIRDPRLGCRLVASSCLYSSAHSVHEMCSCGPLVMPSLEPRSDAPQPLANSIAFTPHTRYALHAICSALPLLICHMQCAHAECRREDMPIRVQAMFDTDLAYSGRST